MTDTLQHRANYNLSFNPGIAICSGRNLVEDKVLVGCEDGTLVLYDEVRKVTQMTSTHLVSVMGSGKSQR